MALVPLMAPALVIVAVAVVIVRRERDDDLIDLTAPEIRLSRAATPANVGTSIGPPTGQLVAAGGATLGARMQRVSEQQRVEPAGTRRRADGRVRHRGTPLVATRT